MIRKIFWTSIILSVVFFIISLVFFLHRRSFSCAEQIDTSKFGEFGDYIGGILGTFFAAASFILLIYTYYLQREDHKINEQNQNIEYINNL